MRLFVLFIATGLAAYGQYINGSRTIEGPINYCADAGSTDDYACSLSPAIAAYTTGTAYTVKANTANTGAATINLNSLGAKTIKKLAGGITTDLADNDIRVGQVVRLVYDGTNMQMVSQVGNAASGSGESNTASNVGASGVGPFYQKSGVDLQFKKLNSLSTFLTITNNTNQIDFDIVPANLSLANLGGTIAYSQIASGSRNGNGTKVQMAGAGTPSTNDCAKFDVDLNIITHGGPCGEVNTVSNIGTAGVGVYKQKTGVNFELKKINAGSSKVTITDDTGSNEIDIDVVPANFTLSGIGGSLNVSQIASGDKQGNGSKVQMFGTGTPATNDCAKFDANGNIVSAGAACGSGGSSSITQTIFLPAAHADLGAASTGFRRPTTNYPEALAVIGTNTIGAVLAFDPSTDESMQIPLLFPTSATAINVRFTWRAIATSGSVVWGIQTACIADGETGDPSFNTAQTVTDTAKGTTLQDNDATISSLTTTGCAAGERMMLKIYRDADNGSDTMTGDAWLVSVAVEITRTL